MTQDELLYISTVARVGSIARAASELFITRSAISRCIKKVEDEFDTPLFTRTPSGLIPTPAGKTYLQYAEMILHTNQKMEAEIREISGVCSGTVRIGSTYSLLAGVFPTMLQRLQKDYPDIVCSIDDHNILVLEDMVQTGKLDFIISHLPPDGPNMQSKEVVTERLYLVFSKNYATQKNLLPQGKMEFSNVNWELLEKLPAYLTHEKMRDRQMVNAVLQAKGLSVTTGSQLCSYYSIFGLVRSGLGFTIAP